MQTHIDRSDMCVLVDPRRFPNKGFFPGHGPRDHCPLDVPTAAPSDAHSPFPYDGEGQGVTIWGWLVWTHLVSEARDQFVDESPD